MSKETLYLGGPMTGRPQFNFPAFDRAAAKLRDHGYTIVSPAELDDPETREAALASADGAPGTGSHSGQTWADFLARDVKLIADKVTGIILLDGWEESRGARLECFVARLEGKPIYLYRPDAPGMRVPLPTEALVHAFTANGLVEEALFEGENGIPIKVQTSEIRVTDPNTGGQKGSKIVRMDLVPAEVRRQDGLVYGAGAKKYDDDNWRRGYDWRLSLSACFRHINAWEQGEDFDEELTDLAGEPVSHLAAARWHLATLFTFQQESLGTCTLPERPEYVGLPNREEAPVAHHRV